MTELIEVVQLNLPFCQNTFGVAPCTATNDVGKECFNTFKTCQDKPNFNEGVKEIYFQNERENPITDLPGIFPTIVNLSRSPSVINIGSVDPDRSPLGTRDAVDVSIKDHPYHDRWVDPYWRTRLYNPVEKGTFWSKFFARNNNLEGVECIVYFGEVGQSIGAMFSLNYELEKIDGPDSSGMVKMKLSDILKRVDDNIVKIPDSSNGKLLADIDDLATDFTLSEIGAGDEYPASGTISIDKEPMTFTRSGDVFTITRTVPVEHKAGATVQLARVIITERVDDILYDWLINDAGIDSSWIDFPDWQAEIDEWNPTALITQTLYKPEGAAKLIGELLRDTSTYFVVDLENKKIILRVIRGVEDPVEVNDEEHILKGSFSLTRRTDLKISQLWFYYAPINLLETFTDKENFGSLLVTVSEDFGDIKRQKIKQIFSRFYSASNINEARDTSDRIIERYSNEPREINFATDREFGKQFKTGDMILIKHRDIVDQFGEPQATNAQIISMSEKDNGKSIVFRTQAFNISSFFVRKIPPDNMDVWTAASDENKNTYLFLTLDNGLMSDGTEGPRLG